MRVCGSTERASSFSDAAFNKQLLEGTEAENSDASFGHSGRCKMNLHCNKLYAFMGPIPETPRIFQNGGDRKVRNDLYRDLLRSSVIFPPLHVQHLI